MRHAQQVIADMGYTGYDTHPVGVQEFGEDTHIDGTQVIVFKERSELWISTVCDSDGTVLGYGGDYYDDGEPDGNTDWLGSEVALAAVVAVFTG